MSQTTTTQNQRPERYAVRSHHSERWGRLWTIVDRYTGKLVYETGYVIAGNAQREAAQLNGHTR